MFDLIDDLPVPIDLVRSYFRSFEVSNGNDRLKARIATDRSRLSFQIAIISSKIDFSGSYPQNRISLERHVDNSRHKGIHLQLSYHKVENPLFIGTLYILLDIDDVNELMDVAEGFLYASYEMLDLVGGNFSEMKDRLFNSVMIMGLHKKKQIFIDKINSSFRMRPLEVIRLDGSRVFISMSDIDEFLEYRKELVPLFRE